MAFPSINFKSTHTDINDHLKDVTESKLGTLEKFIGASPCICDVEFERITNHQQGNVHRVEVNLELNGKFYRAEATTESFEKSVDEVRAELDEMLRRARSKEGTLLKRGGRQLKKLLRWG